MQRITRVCHACSLQILSSIRSKGSQAHKDKTPLRRLLDDASSFGEAEVEAAEPELRWATQPYPTRLQQQTHGSDARVEPRDTTVLLFPGQGSQHLGMGSRLLDIPAAKQLYELASSIVGYASTLLVLLLRAYAQLQFKLNANKSVLNCRAPTPSKAPANASRIKISGAALVRVSSNLAHIPTGPVMR